MRTEIGVAVVALLIAGLVWLFGFSPFWWYAGRHVPPWPSHELATDEYDAALLIPSTERGEIVCGAPFEYGFAGGIIAKGGLYLHVVVAGSCEAQYPAVAVADELSTVLNLGSEQWISITDPMGNSVKLGRRERPAATGPGKPDYISHRVGSSFLLDPLDDLCRGVAIVWGNAPPGLLSGNYTVQTRDQASEIGLVPGQTFQIRVTKP